jgi:hypothetical protein
VKVSNELNHPIRQLPDGVQKMGMVFFSKPESCRNHAGTISIILPPF